MAVAFLRSVADHVFAHHKDNIQSLCIVLPSKRGALFLKKHLAQVAQKTLWLPNIISAEELVYEISGLKTLEEIDLLSHLYESYRICYGSEAESFDSFARWGQLILHDFNEIDRYLADPEQLYENLKDIKVIENWSLGAENLSEYQTNYLRFMNSLGAIYKHYKGFLLANNWAYQGLAYRTAVDKLKESQFPKKFHKIIFAGFNALNESEIKIFNSLYRSGKAEILWDGDQYYYDDEKQEAGYFLRKNIAAFNQHEPSFIENNLTREKNIRIISVPKQIGQGQVVKQELQKLIDAGIPMDSVAVVLANEKLLWPVIQQIPDTIEYINITMEYPLRYTGTYSFVELLIQLQLNFTKQKKSAKHIYHADLVNLLRQPMFVVFATASKTEFKTNDIIRKLTSRNLSFISQKHLAELFGNDLGSIEPLIEPATSVGSFCSMIIGVLNIAIEHLGNVSPDNTQKVELEYLHIMLRNFNRISDLLKLYPHFNDIQSFRHLFVQVVGSASVPFIGEPLRGLQVMGVLESRTLDFEHVIFVNVNEGVLPSGKSNNSFIPNDLKRAFGLPLYLEKDAVYAYHFYRLIQKAKTVTITYDSETDAFGKGEKSRFVTQLQLELADKGRNISIVEEVAAFSEYPTETPNIISIQKNTEVLRSISEKATSNGVYGGLSPSSLISFKECALKFYFKYGARLKETKEVEENAEANTFGSILHLALEKIYQQYIGQLLNSDELGEKRNEINRIVEDSFISFFDDNAPVGKSILQQEVIKVYVKKLMENDMRFIERLKSQNQFLSLIALEKEFSAPILIKLNSETITHYVKGKIDRIDSHGGLVRIIDYKSSVKDGDRFIFDGFRNLLMDKNYNKQLQLVIYAWLVYRSGLCAAEMIRPCVVPFKVFTEEPKYILGADKKPFVFTSEFLQHFEMELQAFISSIFDPEFSFDQTEDEQTHEHCPYKRVCNFND